MDFRTLSKAQANNYELGLRAYMIGVFNKMFVALGITSAVSFLIVSNQSLLRTFCSGGVMLLCTVATLALGFILPLRLHKMSVSTANNLLLLYSALMGTFLSPVIAMYAGKSIAMAFFTAATFFGGMSLVGYTTKKDLTSLGTFMFVGLIVVVLSSLVNTFFIKSQGFSLALSALSVVIFMGLTAYDLQNIKKAYSIAPSNEALSKISIFGALQLYLDFINIFIHLLQIFGAGENKD